MILTVFRSRLRDGVGGDYHAMAEQTEATARAMPGFVSFKSFSAPDGEHVSIVAFDSPETQRAWREHPLHREAQRLGRERWYAEYDITVCEVLHQHRFPERDGGGAR
ncbi:MAG: antibiotic biosynthesis monooxygenase [Sandaracinaceae bacterium]|nr:antibiotic biosynthesis monooxygenase [Sandaracinaceae bacterium]